MGIYPCMCRRVHNFHQLLKEGLAHKKHRDNYWSSNKGSSEFTRAGGRSLVFQGLSLLLLVSLTLCSKSEDLFKRERHKENDGALKQ